mmetsp:Transcript_9490/g.10486  ORF Transcript_9490/g.10486 Transcript_9490/m.10486 type:complete len:150 (+) Transcript_9490:42-491(+)
MPPKVYFARAPLRIHRNYLASKGQVVFRTKPNQNKIQIKQYLENIYNVKVLRVNTVNYDGKIKTFQDRKTGNRYTYRRPAYKTAYVTLVDDEALQMAQREVLMQKKLAQEAAIEGSQPKSKLSQKDLRDMNAMRFQQQQKDKEEHEANS